MWWVGAALAGELTGTVTDSRGDPVAGAIVALYDVRLDLTIGYTGAYGAYAFDLPPGTWRIRVVAPQGVNLAERYHPDASAICDATRVVTPAVVDVTLPAGGEIGGFLVDAYGAPVVGATVRALPAADGAGIDPRTGVSSATGGFQLSGVTQGAVPTEFIIEVSGADVPTQYLPGVYATDLAQPVAVDEGGFVEAGTTVVVPGVTVSGTVTGPSGPLADGTVQAYVPSQLRSVPITDGAFFAAGLPPGELLVWAFADGLGTTYWPDADRPVERYPAVDGEDVVLDLTMPAEAVIAGRLPGDGPFEGTAVVAYNSDRTVGVGAAAAADGSFEIGGLHGGAYTLSAFAEEAGLVEGPVTEAGIDRVFDLAPAGYLDVGELDVAAGGSVSGTVTDLYTGEPVYGALLFAQNRATGALVSDLSDTDGSWEILGVPPGEYELTAEYQAYCLGDPDWAPRWYPDTPTDSLAVSLTVPLGEPQIWNARLAPDVDQDGMDDVWEAQNGLDPSVNDASGDPDGDGFTNIEEYQLGTDPAAVATKEGCGCNTSTSGTGWLALVALIVRRRRR